MTYSPFDGKWRCKAWVPERLETLAGIFALDVSGFAVMSNHLRVIPRR